MTFLWCYAFSCVLHILVIHLTILQFLGHSIDHDIVDHSIGQYTLNHSINLFRMPVLTHSRAKHLEVYNDLSAVPSQSSSQPVMDSIPSSTSTVPTLSSSLVLHPIDYQGSLFPHGDDCSVSNDRQV